MKSRRLMYRYLVIIWLLGLLISCSCKNIPKLPIKRKSNDPEEIRSVLPHLIISSNKTALKDGELDFQLQLKNGTEVEAKLSEYKLKITLQEERGRGSTLCYKDAGNTDHNDPQIDQPVSYFTQQLGLKKGDVEVILPFKLCHPAEVLRVTITVTLEHKDKQDTISPITIIWEKLPAITNAMIQAAAKGQAYTFLAETLIKLQRGELVDINSAGTDTWENTALHQAAKLGDIDIFNALVARGAKLNLKNKDDLDTPLHIALWQKHPEIAKILIGNLDAAELAEKDYEGKTPLHFAIGRDYTEIAKSLINKLAPGQLNKKDNKGKTSFHYAIEQGQAELIKIFIEKLSPEQLNEKGNRSTPLMELLLSGSSTLDVIYLLVKKLDAIHLTVKHNGASPLFWIFNECLPRWSDMPKVIDVIIEKLTPEQLNERTDWGETILFEAIRKGSLGKMAKPLIEKLRPEQLNEKDDKGFTALHFAVQEDEVEIVQTLLKKNVDKTIRNNEGKTPLDLATTGEMKNLLT